MLQQRTELHRFRLIMKIKQDNGLDLTTSERLAVERERLAAVYRDDETPEKIRRLECSYRDEGV